jgi:3-oxoacyl-[acyl-carrier protein] reductase
MVARRHGSIITMASSAARVPTPASAGYAAAKAGVIMLTRHVAHEVGRHGVRVNCLAPHTVLTERVRRASPGGAGVKRGQTLALAGQSCTATPLDH